MNHTKRKQEIIMAFVSKEDKANLAPGIKAVLAKYKVKGSISVRHNSTLVVKVTKGEIDFSEYMMKGEWPKDYIQVNEYWLRENYTGIAFEFLQEMIAAMKGPDFFDHSDSMTDYFHLSHYVDLNIGTWIKPYVFTA